MFNRTSALLLLVFAVVGPVPDAVRAADVPGQGQLEPLGLQLRWQSQAVLDVSRDVVEHVSNDENNVYVQSSAGVLTAFDAENGRRLWATQTGRTDEPAMAAVSNKDIVVVASGPTLVGYNKFTGTQVMNFRLAAPPTTRPVMNDSLIYVPMTGGRIYAYSISVLEHSFRYGTLPEDVALPYVWKFICNEEIRHQPVLGSEAIAFATEAGNLHSVNTTGLARGRSRFQLSMRRPATAALGITENDTSSSIFMLSGDHRVFSVDLLRGVVEWSYPVGRLMSKPPAVIGNDVYVVSTDDMLTRFARDIKSVDYGRPVGLPGYSAPLYLGAGMIDVTVDPTLQSQFNTSGNAVRITTVVPDSVAANSGLQAGDILLTINDVPAISVEVAREIIRNQPLRVERPYDVLRVSAGVYWEDVLIEPPLEIDGMDSVSEAVAVAGVERGSPADQAGFKVGDLLLTIAGQPVQETQQAHYLLATNPGQPAVQLYRADWNRINKSVRRRFAVLKNRIPVIRLTSSGKLISTSPELTVDSGAISLDRRKVRIPMKQWQVRGVETLLAVGRFGAYGMDPTDRLVAIDLRTAEQIGRVPTTGFDVHLQNDLTDQIFLVSSDGLIVCLKEIGPTIRLPDLSPVSDRATVTSVSVQVNDPVEPTGTPLCEVAFPDGTTHTISASVKGVIKELYVQPGDTVFLSDPIALIEDDRFATYHRRPERQPIDVNLNDPTAPAPAPDPAP